MAAARVLWTTSTGSTCGYEPLVRRHLHVHRRWFCKCNRHWLVATKILEISRKYCAPEEAGAIHKQVMRYMRFVRTG